MEVLCSRLRGLAQDCIDKHLTASAIFYADKLVTFSNNSPGDVYLLAQAYFAARQFHRSLSLLRTAGVVELGAEFTYLAGCCLAEAGDWEEVVALLGDDEAVQEPQAYEDSVLEPPGGGAGVRVQAGMCCLRGRAFEALENRGRAAVWYQAALQLDPYCYDAFAALIDGHLLSNEAEVALVERLGAELAEGDRWLGLLLRAKCKKYVQPEVVEAALRELEAPAPEQLLEAGAAATAAAQPQPFGAGGASAALNTAASVGGGASAGAGAAATAAGGAFPIPYMTPPRGASRSGGGSGSSNATPAAGSGAGSGSRRGAGRSGSRRGTRGSAAAVAAAAAAAVGQDTPGSVLSGDEGMDDASASAHTTPHHHMPQPFLSPGAPAAAAAAAGAAAPHRGFQPQGHPLHHHHTQQQQQLDGRGSVPAGSPSPGRQRPPPQPSAAAAAPPPQSNGGGHGCGLGGNVDVIACRAELLFHRGDYEAAYALTRPVLCCGRDPYALQLLPVHLAAATQLAAYGSEARSDLFLLGHRLTEEHPELAVSWYAVGCYYLAARQPEAARRYLGKATQLQRGFAPAWLAYGHAFSAQDERDQAMSAYRTAARLFPGLHNPHLGLGAEYCSTANLPLAERALLAAYDICPDDPAVCHELGVLMYKCGQTAAAAMWLDRALQLLPGGRPTVHWEATLVALGHCMRKLCRFAAAAECYSAALALAPASPGTLAALGYVAQLAGDPRVAVEHYHAALALRPDDPFTTDMLRLALQEYADAAAAEEEAAAAAAADAASPAATVSGMAAGGVTPPAVANMG
ncbi:hypothetical protein PLESTB_000988000 [Pleodorina starrii]|uniref:Uncharacterized protein n=1 Tax=Pleodorina starrii TaxID=330485 RepID=A0A9W6BQ10_9CHLO|nr:hypothetical protein PLESTM_000550600 [Pleodorina starrii]GLC55446.1 hypothetical protein PLESTB_000988000 [Pleodorina starrii]GLC73839.1 hypothetical protein PLESTF_001426400 [Pleodorina starrii]